MATATEVLEYLRPKGGWTIYGEDFASLIYEDKCLPITKKEFDDAFALFDKAKSDAHAAKEVAKQAILTKLGLTADEAALLLG